MHVPELSQSRLWIILPALGCCLWFAGVGPLSAHAAPPPEGYAWRQLNPVVSPGPRYLHGMAYDSRRNVTVLFGGRELEDQLTGHSDYGHCRKWSDDYGTPWRNDTWEFDGRVWQRKRPVHSPPSDSSLMAFDEARSVTVLYAQVLSVRLDPQPYMIERGLWEWDGEDWTEIEPNGNGPDGVTLNAVVYDSRRSVHVLVGSAGGVPETWEYSSQDRSWFLGPLRGQGLDRALAWPLTPREIGRCSLGAAPRSHGSIPRLTPITSQTPRLGPTMAKPATG